MRGWRAWILEGFLMRPCKWLQPDVAPLPAQVLQCQSSHTFDGTGVLAVLAGPAKIAEEFP